LPGLRAFCDSSGHWLFGHVAYDYKNTVQPALASVHTDGIGFPDIFLFQPEILLRLAGNQLTITSSDGAPSAIFDEINASIPAADSPHHAPPVIRPRISAEEYFSIFRDLQSHIRRGDCYEINFCQEFYSEGSEIDPWNIYQRLSGVSPSPFGCFYRLNERFLLCASPERYLRKQGSRVWSQPIKGTYQRGGDPLTDELFRQRLAESAKEKAENVMIVDLVRNDLSRICKEGTVQVDELFGIYTFPQVHQMISTVTGELEPGMGLAEILAATFPMGSMTGAPKRRVMELLERYERTKRGIFSGCVGYVTPEKDLDFNVVIRSLMYEANTRYLSYQAGSAITFNSIDTQEYEECLLKAAAIREILGA